MTLGQRLKKARIKSDLTFRYIVYKTKISETTLLNWESDRNKPSFEGVVKLAEIYGCSLDYLAGKEVETDVNG